MTRGLKRLAIAFATLALLVVACLTLPAIGSVSSEALNISVAHQAGSTTSESQTECTQRRAERWVCSVVDSGGSGTVSYAVVRDGRRCWTAHKVNPDPREPLPLPRTLSGCVQLIDQLWN